MNLPATPPPPSLGAPPRASDVLSTLFEAAKVRATTCGFHRLHDPFQRHFDGAVVHQHRVVRGTCTLQVEDTGEIVDLEEGDFVLLTRRQSHRLVSARAGRNHAEVVVVSGALSRSGESADSLFSLLPPVMHVRAAMRAGTGLLGEAVAIADHVASNMASEAMSARLAEMIFLIGLRRVLAEWQGAPNRWASSAFLHPQMGRAMRALHTQPMRKWTAASLAREAAMSRSAFAELFTRLVGEPPLGYLTRLRMQLAVETLRDGGSVTDVALRVGYASEGAFSKAFKRSLGVSPGAYRAATEAARTRTATLPVEGAMADAAHDATPNEQASLHTKLARIAYDLEHLLPPAICAIMRFDPGERALRHGAAPSLPEAYNRTIDGVRVGPSTGSCGAAVHRRAPVIVRDIGESELWSDFRFLAERFNLRSCWSKPIFDDAGDVLGTFAIYYRERHEPSEVELAIADHLAERARPVLARGR